MDPGSLLVPGPNSQSTEGTAAGVPRLGPSSPNEGRGRVRVHNFFEMAATLTIQNGPDRTAVVNGDAVLFTLRTR